jgi:hypothetical protein
MKRTLALTVPVSLAACLSLGSLTGCTIYTYSKPPRAKPKAAATATTTKGPIVKNPKAGKGGKGTTPSPTDVPTVTSSTVFGSSAVAAFHGYAYVIPEGTTKVPNFDDLVPFGQFYTDQFNVTSQNFTGGFPGALLQDEWFAIRYTGSIFVPGTAKWSFKLVSDDGAILYIDGKKVIDNDGVHAEKTTSGEIDLEAGKHALQLDYFQEKKGNVALQLFVNVAGRDVPVQGVR